MGGLEDMDFSKAYIKYRVISKKHSYIDIKDLSLNYDCIIIKEHLRTASVISFPRRKYYDPTKDKYYNTVYEGHLKSETINGIDILTALPVELLEYHIMKGDNNKLEWSTASEINNSHFI